MNDHLSILVGLELGETPAKTVVDWAVSKIEQGTTSETINELAWLNEPSKLEVLPLFKKAIVELGLTLPSDRELKLLTAKCIAQHIVEGKLNPNDGCSRIAEINRELDWPQELSAFGVLAHEQTGHEHIGITAESVQSEIVQEARKLIKET